MKTVTSFIAVLLILGVTSVAHCKVELQVVTEQWAPFSFINKDGAIDGTATRKVRTILEAAQISYSIELLAWNRAYNQARDNKNVLLYTIYRLQERENDFQWICPLIETNSPTLYALASRKDISITNLNDAKQYSIGIIGSGWTHDYLIQKGFEAGQHLDVASDENANIRKLLKGRVDIIVQEAGLVESRLLKEGVSAQKIKKVFSLVDTPYHQGCMAVSKDTPLELVETLRNGLQKLNTEISE